ncbi:protein DGCR6L [Silurus asotus]|uniref:Protein DGCR6L n=1 Tax=Silurus asotus TaxID=30991 RepID=A0AAD5B836_SILAS|nr:protein DGCR6L [Silurus asotus]
MEKYASLYKDSTDATKQQERHYYLLSELQILVKDLPSWFQQRLSYTTLSDLAHALIDGTVYEIVHGLLDIQHLTEKNLYNQRQKLHTEHRGILGLEQRVKDEQRMMDEKIVAEMDQKVLDQQNTLEKAGVPGFYITSIPQEVTMQINLLELILKLQQKESQPGKLP